MRTRLTEYAMRFVRIAARYEEEYLGSTSIGYSSTSFEFTNPSEPDGHLGSGLAFIDDVSGAREMLANAGRIEGWRHTKSYEYYKTVSKPVSLLKGLYPSEYLYPRILNIAWRTTRSKGLTLHTSYGACGMARICLMPKLISS